MVRFSVFFISLFLLNSIAIAEPIKESAQEFHQHEHYQDGVREQYEVSDFKLRLFFRADRKKNKGRSFIMAGQNNRINMVKSKFEFTEDTSLKCKPFY